METLAVIVSCALLGGVWIPVLAFLYPWKSRP
jgi:hypothetical protein